MEAQGANDNQSAREVAIRTDRQRLRTLCVGFGLYFLLMLYAIGYATRIPGQFLALAGLVNMGIIISFLVAINTLRKRTLIASEARVATTAPVLRKYEGLRKLRWLFFVGAVIGIVSTPSAILTAIVSATADHRLIIPYAGAVVIRLLTIGFFIKIWWETGR